MTIRKRINNGQGKGKAPEDFRGWCGYLFVSIASLPLSAEGFFPCMSVCLAHLVHSDATMVLATLELHGKVNVAALSRMAGSVFPPVGDCPLTGFPDCFLSNCTHDDCFLVSYSAANIGTFFRSRNFLIKFSVKI